MHPILLTIGPFTVYSFGLALAVAVIVCSWLMARDARRSGIAKDVVYDFVFWVVLSGILGSRIFYIILNLDFFSESPSEFWKIQNGGLAWQGGLILGFAAALIYLRKNKLPVFKFLDMVSPYAALGQAIGRVGCFLNGCCQGKHADWGPFFPVHQDHLHPTQIYESIGLVAVFFVLKRLDLLGHAPGRTFAVYFMLAASLRFVVQFFRYDYNPIVLGLGLFQIVCVIVFAVSAVFYFYLRKRPGSIL